jgi:sialate O-acetylesterase
MKYNSALAYFFAQRLQEELKDVPIGLIISAWGGTPAEVWIPEKTVQNNPTLLSSCTKIKSF